MQDIISLSKKLISYKSETNNTVETRKIIEFCRKYISQNLKDKISVKIYNSNNFYSLTAVPKGIKTPEFCMVGHLDVVPAPSSEFKPKVKGNRLYGRGASDMKGVTAAMIQVFIDILRKNPDKSIALMLTTDEEIGGFNGVNYILNKKGFRCKCAFIPDGGDNWKMVIEEKGIAHIKIITKGKSVHGSRPWLGENAIEKLIDIYRDLRKQFPHYDGSKTWKESMNLGKISGGEAINKVPDTAEMYLDFRFTKSKSPKQIIDTVKNIVGNRGKVYPLITAEVNAQDKNNKYIKSFHKYAEKVLRRNIPFVKINGGSDARFFAQYNIPTIIIKPKSGNQHGLNEWIDIKDLQKFYDVLRGYVEGLV